MSEKTKKISYWAVSGLVAFVFLGSAIGKLTADEKAMEMAESMGLDSNTYKLLGFVEILSLVLFILPRTGIIGTLLLCAYMGGAIATHLEHGQSVLAPCIIQAVLWATAFYRFPELSNKLRNK